MLAGVVVVGVLIVRPLASVLQADPHIGTWVLNVAQSKYSPGPAPKQQTSVYSMKGESLTVTTKGLSPDGKPLTTEFTAGFDGKDYAVKGNPDWDAVSIKRVDPQTIEFVRKRAGQVVQNARSVVAKDGRTRTVTVTGVNAQGQKMSTVGVYDRK